MRRQFIALMATFMALTRSSAAFSSPVQPTTDSSFIYVYRVGQFTGSGANWAVFLDDQKICKLSNNKYMKIPVGPGKHRVSAKVGGVGLLKKETEIEVEVEAGGNYYIACNVKSSITRVRLEMIEVTKNSANKQMEKMSLDRCQEDIDESKSK